MRTRPRATPLARRKAVPWLVHGLWAALPLTAGPALADALHGASGPVRAVASVGLWASWAVGVPAAFVPHPVALTALRVLAPAAAAAAVAAAAAGHPSALAVGWTFVAAGWALSPAVGWRWVNGPAYPNERRYPLRAPAPLLVGPLALAWALAVAGVAAGPLLLAAGRWVAGGLAVATGAPLSWLLLRSLHNLSRRWAVFVPAGIVLHDPITLFDPVLLPRRAVAALRPATAGTGALDLTQRAPGLALEVVLDEDAALTLLAPGRREGRPARAKALLFTPTRPGAVLDEARRRKLPVG